jgi:patatin-like phospholipase/acyl hydrolase
MSQTQAERWGQLWSRYHDPNRLHKLLALDGGGIRGLITLGILLELEQKLADRTGEGSEFRLGNWFDYIGGTSTGAIIAAGLARGLAVADLIQFYRDSGKAMFEKTSLLKRLSSFYEVKLAQRYQMRHRSLRNDGSRWRVRVDVS